MCDTPTLTPYITAFGGIAVGGLISFFVGAGLSRKNHANALILLGRQEAHKAFLILEASFLPALRILKRTGTKDFDKIPTFFDSQDIAKLSFVRHLTGENRVDFEKKWKKYKEWQEGYEEVIGSETEIDGLLKMCGANREPFIKMLEEILEAAKKY